jgi:uncharacterized protein (UPF0332 family)
MQWDAFLVTARWLATGTTEGDWRSAISRAYYAVFHFFREWLEANGTSLGKSAQAHNNLVTGLLNCGDSVVKGIAVRIDFLRVDRTKADYDFNKTFKPADAQLAIARAEQIVADLRSHLTIVSASIIVTGYVAFLQSIHRLPPTP